MFTLCSLGINLGHQEVFRFSNFLQEYVWRQRQESHFKIFPLKKKMALNRALPVHFSSTRGTREGWMDVNRPTSAAQLHQQHGSIQSWVSEKGLLARGCTASNSIVLEQKLGFSIG